MKNLIGSIACFIVRLFGGSHVWRRLRKTELLAYMAQSCASANLDKAAEIKSARICGRCGFTRSVKPRERKATAITRG